MADNSEKLVDVVDPKDNRHYTVIVETLNVDENGNEYSQILNMFADGPYSAFHLLGGITQLYDQPNVKKVTLVGVYGRTMLKVIDVNKNGEQ